jgi:hypothetical protein
VAAGLGDEEDGDQGGEEHEVAAEGEEHAETVAGKFFTGTAATCGAVVPVVAVASAAGALVALVIGRTAA